MKTLLLHIWRKLNGRDITSLVAAATRMQDDIDANIAFNDKAIEGYAKAITDLKAAQDALESNSVTGRALKKQLSLG